MFWKSVRLSQDIITPTDAQPGMITVSITQTLIYKVRRENNRETSALFQSLLSTSSTPISSQKVCTLPFLFLTVSLSHSVQFALARSRVHLTGSGVNPDDDEEDSDRGLRQAVSSSQAEYFVESKVQVSSPSSRHRGMFFGLICTFCLCNSRSI